MPYPYMQPYMQQPYPQPYQQAQQSGQPVHGFVYVTGIEGAKAYQMPPNSEMPLFDSTSENVMFIKTTDGAGFPTIKVVRCTPEESQPQPQSEWATLDDVNSLRKEIDSLREALYEMGGPRGKHVSTPAE